MTPEAQVLAVLGLLVGAYHVHGALNWRGRVRIEVELDTKDTSDKDTIEGDDSTT